MRRGTRITLPIVFFLALVASAHAESIVWNTSFGATQSYFRDLRYPGGGFPGLAGHGGWVQFSPTQDQITYRIQVTDVKTGGVLAPDAEVPKGDKVRFEFIPHVYSDITWFTSGGPQDSPYGYWIPGAAPPPITCTPADQVGSSFDGVGPQNSFVAHSVNPPAKTLTIPSGMTCDAPDADGSQVCSFNAAGSYTPVFNWAATNGNFYLRMTSPRFASGCMGSSNSYYNLAVPAQTYPFPLTVVVSNETPSAPIIAAAVAGAVCVVGQPHTLTMTASDPQGETIRYGIDWDANGRLDQFVPANGYVPSGTPQAASRTYSTVGSKTVKVLAQNSKGLTSGWTTAIFTCVAAPEEATAELSVVENQSQASGIDDNDIAADAALNLRVVPSLVRSGATTKVNWSATNVKSCIVSAPNGDSWNSALSAIGGEISKPITSETTYTLSCIDLKDVVKTKTATVKLIPSFQEI